MITIRTEPDISIPVKGYLSYSDYLAWRQKHNLDTSFADPKLDSFRLTCAAFTFKESQEAILFKLEFGI